MHINLLNDRYYIMLTESSLMDLLINQNTIATAMKEKKEQRLWFILLQSLSSLWCSPPSLSLSLSGEVSLAVSDWERCSILKDALGQHIEPPLEPPHTSQIPFSLSTLHNKITDLSANKQERERELFTINISFSNAFT